MCSINLIGWQLKLFGGPCKIIKMSIKFNNFPQNKIHLKGFGVWAFGMYYRILAG